jgi:hypothetical protein
LPNKRAIFWTRLYLLDHLLLDFWPTNTGQSEHLSECILAPTNKRSHQLLHRLKLPALLCYALFCGLLLGTGRLTSGLLLGTAGHNPADNT